MSAYTLKAEVRSGSVSTMKGEEGTPRERAQARLYIVGDKVVIPAPNLFAAIIAAGRFQKVGASKLTTIKSSVIPGSLAILEPHFVIDPQDWEVDIRAIRNKNGEAIPVCRPRFDKWSIEFTLDIDENDLSESVVRRLVDDAGKKIGLCSFRPSTKGPYGRFHVVEWREVG
jgi:hypothetical protein